MLAIKNVTKKYRDFSVLESINLEFSNGIYGLLAANGAGKTTLIKMLATLSFPTEGEILCDGCDIYAMGEHYRTQLGYLPQTVGYYPHATAREYLEYLGVLKGLARPYIKKRVPELMEMVGLSDVMDKKMRKFSGGMVQRTGIAQALLGDPKILLLDEPTSGLDPKERVRFRNILAQLSRDRTIILSTHIVSDVETVANQLILLKDKGVLYRGSVQELCQNAGRSIFEASIPASELPDFAANHYILTQKQDGDSVIVRFTGASAPDAGYAVIPTLEEVFLTTYR